MFAFFPAPQKQSLLGGAVFFLASMAITADARQLQGISTNEERSAQQHWSPFHCLSTAIYFEARSEPVKGQRAVGQVILNRARNAAHPDTVCGVVYENTGKKHRCQFSFACDGREEQFHETGAYLVAQNVARGLLACDEQCRAEQQSRNPIAGSTHYHTHQVAPGWAGRMVKTGIIGGHIFYADRTPRQPRKTRQN